MAENQNLPSLFKFRQPQKVILQNITIKPYIKPQNDVTNAQVSFNSKFQEFQESLKRNQHPATGSQHPVPVSQQPAQIFQLNDQTQIIKMQSSHPYTKVLIKPIIPQKNPLTIAANPQLKIPFRPRILKPKLITFKSLPIQSQSIEGVLHNLNTQSPEKNPKVDPPASDSDSSDLEQFEAIPPDAIDLDDEQFEAIPPNAIDHDDEFEMPPRPEINEKLIQILTNFRCIAHHAMMKKNLKPFDFENIRTDYRKLYKELVNKE